MSDEPIRPAPKPLWWPLRALFEAVLLLVIFAGSMALTGAPIDTGTAVVFGALMIALSLVREYRATRSAPA